MACSDFATPTVKVMPWSDTSHHASVEDASRWREDRQIEESMLVRRRPSSVRPIGPITTARAIAVTAAMCRGVTTFAVLLMLRVLISSSTLLASAGVNDGGIGAYARYGMAKLASLAFSAELSRRHAATALVSAAVHPGVVATELLRVDNFAAMLGRAAPSAALCLSPAPPAPARADR